MSLPAEHIVRQGGDIPAHLAEAFRQASTRALNLSREEYEPYRKGNMEARLAGFNPFLQRAEALSRSSMGGYEPYFRKAEHHAGRGAESFLNNYRDYLNPRQDVLLRGIEEEGQRALKEKALPDLEARYISLGQHGGTKHAKMAKRVARDIQREIANRQEESLSKNYTQALKGFSQDRTRELEASNLLSRLGIAKQASNIAEIRALQEAGLLQQDREQMQKDWEHEQWKEEKRHPYESLAHYFSILQGTPFVPSMYRRSEIRQVRPSWHHQDWRDLGLGMLTDYVFNPRR